MMARVGLTFLVALVVLGATACRGAESVPAATPPAPAAEAPSRCEPAPVHYGPYPGHGNGLGQLPWIPGKPGSAGLVGLLWYWPDEWRRDRVAEARIYTGGVAPQGWNTKILWAFVSPAAKERGGSELVVAGRRLDGPGRFKDSFAAIGYAGQRGAPSYASIIEVPRAGCWRLTLTTGSLRGEVDMRADDADTQAESS